MVKKFGMGVLLKDIFREITKTKNRFLSIFLIVAIGVGFFAGLTASGPDMKLTADTYFERQRLSDFRLVSTIGFSDEDLQALRDTEGVRAVQPGHWVDTVLETQGESEVVKAIGYDFDRLDGEDAEQMNLPVLLEGRFPQAPDECVVEAAEEIFGVALQLGDSITLTSGRSDTDLTDTLSTDRFTIVGIVQSPLYISIGRGTSTLGSGKVNAFILVPNEAFLEDYYTEIYLLAEGVEGLSSYSEEYRRRIDELALQLEQIGEKRAAIRLEQIRAEAAEKIADAQKELDEGVRTQQEELAAGRQELDDARDRLSQGENELAEATEAYYDSIADAQKQLSNGRQELNDGEGAYESGLREYERGQDAYDQAMAEGQAQMASAQKLLDETQAQLTQGQAQYDQVRALVPDEESAAFVLNDPSAAPEQTAQLAARLSALAQSGAGQEWAGALTDYLSNPAAMTPQQTAYHLAAVRQVNQELDAQKQQLQAGWAQLNEGKKQLEEGLRQLDAAGGQLDDAADRLREARQALDEGWAQLAEKEQAFLDGKEEGWQALVKAGRELSDSRQELADGEREWEEGKAASDQEIASAREQLDKAKRDLEALKTPKWYVLDRTDYPGHADFGGDADRIAAIARVFPLFFLLVAALVCLTTMTRMVEEQRVQIGTLKALGYRSGVIGAKFLIYALTATVAGSLAGLLVGMRLFPTIIYNAYGILYTMIPVQAPFRAGVAALSTLAAAVTVLATVLLSCRRELAEQPALLMRPKAPKAGKRVLLERIGFFWNRLSFSYKVTFRNLFRYKKRMLMTVVGIAGCSALMLTGFGLYDAIRDIVGIQFGQLYHYDLTTVLEQDQSDSQRREAESLLFSHPQVKDSLYVQQESFQLKAPGKKAYDLYLFVPENPQRLEDFVTLRTRKGHESLSLEKEEVVLTEKAARFLGIEAGEQITITDADHRSYTVTVGGIAEQYTGHYLYMTPQAYEKYFGRPAAYNMVQSILHTPDLGEQDALSRRLTACDGVLAVSDTATIKSQFSDMIHSMTYVMLLLIVSAGALAFVVLYNLSNINANERVREIATIKVLGFYDREVSAYLYRENIFLTLLGALTGLILGIFLHHYVVVTAETDIVMFGRTIRWMSYVFSGALTLAFSLLVNWVMHFKLKKISMVESLKSIE